jgi:hypothetical protein
MRKKTMSLAIGIAIATTVLIGAVPAGAATPATRGCVGASVSAFSTTYVRSGWAYRDFAQETTSRPGLGDALQGLQAGAVSDADFPNSCNG